MKYFSITFLTALTFVAPSFSAPAPEGKPQPTWVPQAEIKVPAGLDPAAEGHDFGDA